MMKNSSKNGLKIIDLTHTFTRVMPVHAYDDPATIEQIRTISQHSYNDWKVSSGMHVGTHIDGPGHLSVSSAKLSEASIEKFVGKGYLIDARNKPINISLFHDMPVEDDLVVLILTGHDKKFGSQDYFNDYPMIPVDVASQLVLRKIKMIGIDCFSPDYYPFETHKIFLNNKVYIIENLTNLEQLLNVKHFTVIALPLKTETDSALARVIAIVDVDQ